MTEVVSLERDYDKALEMAIEFISQGESIIYPTDTVYGIGCDATNKQALEKLYEIKERERSKPVSVLVGNLNQLTEFFDVEKHVGIIQRYLPGPYTFIIEAKNPLADLIGKKVGVRVPDNFFCRKLAVEVEAPIVSTSANISGNAPATSLDELDEIKDRVPLLIDGGRLKYGSPSTVVDLVERKIVRQGAGKFLF